MSLYSEINCLHCANIFDFIIFFLSFSNALEKSGCIEVKKRSGCLSHLEDPDRLKSLFSQTLTSEQYICWEIDPKALERFSNEPYVIKFTDRFLHLDELQTSSEELALKQQLTMLFYNAVVKDKMHVLPIYIAVYNVSLNYLRNPFLWPIEYFVLARSTLEKFRIQF